MAWYHEPGAEEKCAVLIRHLVLGFPQASILSWQVGARYHVFVVVPHDGSREKTLQVDTHVFHDPRLRVEEFAARLSTLELRALFARGDRYNLDRVGQQEETHRTPARSGPPASTQAQIPASLMR